MPRLIFHVFQNRSPGPFLEGPVPNFYKQLVWVALYDCRGVQKGTLSTTFSPEVSTFAVPLSWFGRPSFSRPCFSRNQSNYGAV